MLGTPRQPVCAGVGLSHSSVHLLPTYVTKMSQKTFKVINQGHEPVRFAVKARQTPEEDLEATRQGQDKLRCVRHGRA